MKRRSFLTWVGVGGLASSLPIVIAACSSNEESPSTEATAPAESASEIDKTPRPDGFAAVGTVAELDEAGFISDKQFSVGPVVVIRSPDNADTLVAVNATCPHQACKVDWKGESFDCPCHGSKFAVDGSVTNGPAEKSLALFEAKVDGDLVLVKG